MGIFSALFSIFSKKKELKLIIVGLDNSGKTTIINRLKPKKNFQRNEVTPTVGYSIEIFTKNNINFTVFDMSGQGKYRDMWAEYCKGIDGIIFVIDSADKLRFAVAKAELNDLLQLVDVKKKLAPILFFANKMDMPGSQGPNEFVELLELSKMTDRNWQIMSSNALTGEGLEDGMKWLIGKLAPKKK